MITRQVLLLFPSLQKKAIFSAFSHTLIFRKHCDLDCLFFPIFYSLFLVGLRTILRKLQHACEKFKHRIIPTLETTALPWVTVTREVYLIPDTNKGKLKWHSLVVLTNQFYQRCCGRQQIQSVSSYLYRVVEVCKDYRSCFRRMSLL